MSNVLPLSSATTCSAPLPFAAADFFFDGFGFGGFRFRAFDGQFGLVWNLFFVWLTL